MPVHSRFLHTPSLVPSSSTSSSSSSCSVANLLNSYASLIPHQHIAVIPSFILESSITLTNVPVAYSTWGSLNVRRDNCMVICHALSGSTDVSDWWEPLLKKKRAFDPSKYFIVCLNVLGSPYGTASPVSIHPVTGKRYGPEFPQTTIRDDIHLHKLVLDILGVHSIAVVLGGSMGGMHVLEWALLYPWFVRAIIPISTCGRHSAWGISWGEVQRRSIYADPNYRQGWYEPGQEPNEGLATARVTAMMTYRSRASFVARFGRRVQPVAAEGKTRVITTGESHSEVCTNGQTTTTTATMTLPLAIHHESQVFSAQSYLRYQGQKFYQRFDANCYIALTKKLDTHDVARERGGKSYEEVLQSIKHPALVVGVESDGLFGIEEQSELAEAMPNATLKMVNSGDGHDGFLLEFAQLDEMLRDFLKSVVPEVYKRKQEDNGEEGVEASEEEEEEANGGQGCQASKSSLFGEVEVGLGW